MCEAMLLKKLLLMNRLHCIINVPVHELSFLGRYEAHWTWFGGFHRTVPWYAEGVTYLSVGVQVPASIIQGHSIKRPML